MYEPEEQTTQSTLKMVRQPDGSGGTTLDFASDYPGVMILLVSILFGAVVWFLKKRHS